MQVSGDALPALLKQRRRAALEADQVGLRRVLGGPELGEVSAAAEGRAAAAQVDLGDRRVGDHDVERLTQGVPCPGVHRVPGPGPVEGDREPGVVAVEPYRLGSGTWGARARLGQPRAEAASALEHRVGEGLGDQPFRRRQPRAHPEHLHQRHGCGGLGRHDLRQPPGGCLRVGAPDPGPGRIGGARDQDVEAPVRFAGLGRDPDEYQPLRAFGRGRAPIEVYQAKRDIHGRRV
jgi:hypothetical protein